MAEEQVASVQLLKNFAPLDAMKRENLAALAKKVSVRTLSAGRVLFSQGDTDKRTLWLVSGSVEVNENERNIAMLRSGRRAAQRSRRCAGRMVAQAFVQAFGRAAGASGLGTALDRGPTAVGLEALPVACRKLSEPRHHRRYAACTRVGEGAAAKGCKAGAEQHRGVHELRIIDHALAQARHALV